ncbi:hypothetical protein ACL2XP_05660 [Sodalis sp. RH21]|uniref:hypothetical protein n=1 Tax=unclassified Sodalis (in: enterobacteria) TaxID=2636512 RepID=UPI0039B6345B
MSGQSAGVVAAKDGILDLEAEKISKNRQKTGFSYFAGTALARPAKWQTSDR